jgi:hypothetical protein
MTVRDDLDRHVAAWLATDAPTSPPEHLLGDVLARTARTRRRPAWRIPERWIPMSAITSRFATSPGVPWRTIAVAALLIALLAGALLVAGSLRNRVPPPFGPAANGAVYYSMNGDLMVADSATATPRTLLAGDANDNAPQLSPDGTRMTFVNGEIATKDAQLWTAASDGSTPRKLADTPTIGWAEWSPGSDTVAVLMDRSPSTIFMIDADSGSTTEIDSGLAYIQKLAWRPPDGAQLAMRGRDAVTTQWGIYLINRDGTGLQRLNLDPGYESDPTYDQDSWSYFDGVAWSADGSRLLYYGPEPAPDSPAGPGFRNHVASIDAGGAVIEERILEFDASMDDEFAGAWLSEDSILYQTVEGLEHRMVVGSLSEGQGSARDLGVSVNDWIPYFLSPDTQSMLVSLPGPDGSRDIRSIDLATGASTPTQLGADDISWQRLAP